MNELVAWTLAGLGLGVVAVRQRNLAVALVTAQAAVLVAVAGHEAHGADDLVAAVALAVRSAIVATALLVLGARARESRPVPASLGPLRRAGLGAALALVFVWLVPAVGLPSRALEQAVLALVGFGLVTAATGRGTLQQVLGIVVIENALVLAALALPGTSWLVELGVAVDLLLLVAVAGTFHRRIVTEFGAGDTTALRSLRD